MQRFYKGLSHAKIRSGVAVEMVVGELLEVEKAVLELLLLLLLSALLAMAERQLAHSRKSRDPRAA